MKNFLLIASLIVALLFGFGVYRLTTSMKNVVVVYTPHLFEFVDGINKRFEAKYPGLKIQVVHAKTTDLESRIRSETSHPLGDVMFGGDVGTYIQMKRAGLIQPVALEASPYIPEDMKDADGFWYAPYRLPGIFFYNNTLLTTQRAPKDWPDLIKPDWKDAILFLNPTQSGTARTFFISLVTVWGEEAAFDFFRKLDAQVGSNYIASPDKLFGAIARGEGLVGLWNEADILKLIYNEKMPFGFVYPASGTYMNPEPIAVIAGAPHAKFAKEYVNFIFEQSTLEYTATTSMKRPTRVDFPKDKLPIPLQTMPKAFPIDWSNIGDKGTDWLKKLSKEIWDKKLKS